MEQSSCPCVPSVNAMELATAVSLKIRTRVTEEQLGERLDSSHDIKQCDTEEKANRKRDTVCKSKTKQSVTLLALLICFPVKCHSPVVSGVFFCETRGVETVSSNVSHGRSRLVDRKSRNATRILVPTFAGMSQK